MKLPHIQLSISKLMRISISLTPRMMIVLKEVLALPFIPMLMLIRMWMMVEMQMWVAMILFLATKSRTTILQLMLLMYNLQHLRLNIWTKTFLAETQEIMNVNIDDTLTKKRTLMIQSVNCGWVNSLETMKHSESTWKDMQWKTTSNWSIWGQIWVQWQDVAIWMVRRASTHQQLPAVQK